MDSKPKLLAIVGPTASGKSELALKIAKKYGGEIIAADSRTLYRGMDIGTAKPTKKERTEVVHWGLDLIKPGEVYSAKRFKEYAQAKIEDIQKRGRLPILVGGTGLYVDSVLFDFGFRPAGESKERRKLEKLSVEQLQDLIAERGLKMPENKHNKRHLIRTIESDGQSAEKKESLSKNILVIGLSLSSEALKEHIERRTNKMLKAGLLDEARGLLTLYGQTALEKTGGISYRASLKFLDGELGKGELEQFIKTKEWQYARRQRTWFKRNTFIHWYDDSAAAKKAITSFLNT